MNALSAHSRLTGISFKAIGLASFFATGALFKYQPAMGAQWVVAGVLFFLGGVLIRRAFQPEGFKDAHRIKLAKILAVLGLSGLIVPVLGFAFALPACLICIHLITADRRKGLKTTYVSGAVALLCIVNANLGTLNSFQ